LEDCYGCCNPHGRGVATRGLEIYDRDLRPLLEPAHNGAQIAIHVEDGDYALGESMADAIQELAKRHPDAVFCLLEVGFDLHYREGAQNARRS
jgi:hypothetical protein